jgi:hypothetical protein
LFSFKLIGANFAMRWKHHFQNEELSKLNNAFYFIDFNAEEKRTVVFNKTLFNSNTEILEHMNWPSH